MNRKEQDAIAPAMGVGDEKEQDEFRDATGNDRPIDMNDESGQMREVNAGGAIGGTGGEGYGGLDDAKE